MAGFFKNREEKVNKPSEVIKGLLLDNNPEGLIAVDDQGNVIYSNKLGNEIMSKGLFGPIDIISRNTKIIEYNERTYEARYQRISESAGIRGVMAYLVDTIGETKQANEIAELKSQLEKANGFKAAFLANMSHEIRTPIHAIIGFAEMLLKEIKDDSVAKNINMIKDSSYSLLAIINDVLDLSKIESGKLEMVNSNYYISYIIRDIEATYSMQAVRKDLKFEIHLDDNIPSYMYGDKIRIRGVLLNLLNNAIKFTKEGRVDFYIHVLEKVEDTVTLQFVVKDTGIGIKKEDQERIFESFSKFDIDNNYSIEGRGLGLSIAKGYLDLMGGQIEVKSEYGVGSTFTVTLQQKIVDDSPVDMQIVNARKKQSEKFTIKDYNVLVVDDNPVNLKVAEGLMKTYGVNVTKANGGREAIDICLDNTFDLILMDQMMPDVDGCMAMREIRKISDYYNDECKIIVLTADAMAGVRDRLLAEGFDEYLCKPLEIHRLESTLHKFVPEEKIISDNTDISIEPGNGSVSSVVKDDIETLAEQLIIPVDVLRRKVKDSGGQISDYRKVCEIAEESSEKRVEKLREAHTTKDYRRYITLAHSLKSASATLGAMDISEMAREQEAAGKEGRYDFIDENIDEMLYEYNAFMNRIRKYVLGMDSVEEAPSESAPTGDEWSKEDICKICRRITSMVEEFNFGAIYDLLEDVLKMDMGPKTYEVFSDLQSVMNDMDIDGLKARLGEYT